MLVLLPSSVHCLCHTSLILTPSTLIHYFMFAPKMCAAAFAFKLFIGVGFFGFWVFFAQLPWAKVLLKFRTFFLLSSSCTVAKNKEWRGNSPLWMPGAEEAVRWRLGVGESKHCRGENKVKGTELDKKRTMHKLREKTADFFFLPRIINFSAILHFLLSKPLTKASPCFGEKCHLRTFSELGSYVIGACNLL